MNYRTEEFIQFIKRSQENKTNRPLKEHLAEELLRQLVSGDREITDMATDPMTGDVFARFSFTKEEKRDENR